MLAVFINLKGRWWQGAEPIGGHGPQVSLAGLLTVAVPLASLTSCSHWHLPCLSLAEEETGVPSSQPEPDSRAEALGKPEEWGSDTSQPQVLLRPRGLGSQRLTVSDMPPPASGVASLTRRWVIRIPKVSPKWLKNNMIQFMLPISHGSLKPSVWSTKTAQ